MKFSSMSEIHLPISNKIIHALLQSNLISLHEPINAKYRRNNTLLKTTFLLLFYFSKRKKEKVLTKYKNHLKGLDG